MYSTNINHVNRVRINTIGTNRIKYIGVFKVIENMFGRKYDGDYCIIQLKQLSCEIAYTLWRLSIEYSYDRILNCECSN